MFLDRIVYEIELCKRTIRPKQGYKHVLGRIVYGTQKFLTQIVSIQLQYYEILTKMHV